MKHVDLEKPTTFLDQVYLGFTQRECGPDSSLVDGYRKMFESQMSAGATEKLPDSGKMNSSVIPWSYDMEGPAKKCVERHCESAKKNIEPLYDVSTRCIDDHSFKKEELGTVGKLSTVFCEIVPKCLYLARIDRPDILCSANSLARAVTEWTGACD